MEGVSGECPWLVSPSSRTKEVIGVESAGGWSREKEWKRDDGDEREKAQIKPRRGDDGEEKK